MENVLQNYDEFASLKVPYKASTRSDPEAIETFKALHYLTG